MLFSSIIWLFASYLFVRKLFKCNFDKMNNQVFLPNVNSKFEEIKSYTDKEMKPKNEFENLKFTIKMNMTGDLDYSLLEDQVMPEMCESPEVETKRKKSFALGLSPLLKNMSFANDKNWQEEISDESFIRTEKLIRGEELNSTGSTVRQNISDEYKDEMNSLSKDSLNKSEEESMKFNDTLEEMEYFLKHGNINLNDNKIENKSESIVDLVTEKAKEIKLDDLQNKPYNNTPIKSNYLKVNSIERTPKSIPRFVHKNITPKTPKSLSKPNFAKTPNELKVPNCPLYSLTPFKVPNSKMTPNEKSVPKYTKPNLKSLNQIDRFENVISPIQCYIKNSPIVPIMKNVSPGKDYWERLPPKNVYQQTNLAKKTVGKENINLPEMAYKSPKLTNLVEKPTNKRLPKNNHKVVSVAENLPKPLVIKHLKRDKVDSKKQSNLPQAMMTKKPDDESFAHLPIKSHDVSTCIGKPAARTRTLK